MERKKTRRAVLIIIAIALFLELVVFNINSFRLWGNREYIEETLPIELANLNEIEKTENGYYLNSNTASIEWNNLNKAIGTIKIDIQISGNNRVSYEARIFYTDDTAKYYYEEEPLQTKEIVNEVDRTKYFTCHMAGKVRDLKIEILNAQNCKIDIKGVTINQAVPYQISWWRLVTMLTVTLGIYFLLHAHICNIPYEKENPIQQCILQFIWAGFAICLLLYTLNGNASFEFNKNGATYENLLVDSLLQGKTELPVEPSEELKNMENPYDYTARKEEGISYLYDVAYYDGNYYLYFSVLPILTLFLPFKLLTGYYFPLALACLLYAMIGAAFTILFTKNIIKRFFPTISFKWTALASILMLFASFLLFNSAMSRIYELVSLMGYMLVMMGMTFLLKAWEKESIYFPALIARSIMSGISNMGKTKPNNRIFIISTSIMETDKQVMEKQR